MGKLITPSILGAVDFAKNAHGDWKQKGYDGLVRQLSRVYDKEMPAPIKRGIDFENKVYQCARRKEETWLASKDFTEIVSLVRGGRFQEKAKRNMTVDGIEYTYYGKLDVLMPGKIIDIKTTGKYQPPQKYLSTAQHLIYSWATYIPDFTYLVVVMNEQNQIEEYYLIDWTSPGEDEVGDQLARITRQFRKDLEDMELTELYLEKFCLF